MQYGGVWSTYHKNDYYYIKQNFSVNAIHCCKVHNAKILKHMSLVKNKTKQQHYNMKKKYILSIMFYYK